MQPVKNIVEGWFFQLCLIAFIAVFLKIVFDPIWLTRDFLLSLSFVVAIIGFFRVIF